MALLKAPTISKHHRGVESHSTERFLAQLELLSYLILTYKASFGLF